MKFVKKRNRKRKSREKPDINEKNTEISYASANLA